MQRPQQHPNNKNYNNHNPNKATTTINEQILKIPFPSMCVTQKKQKKTMNFFSFLGLTPYFLVLVLAF